MLTKQLRHVRRKVERTGNIMATLPGSPYTAICMCRRRGLPVTRCSVMLVMFAGVTKPRSISRALRLVFEDPEADVSNTPFLPINQAAGPSRATSN